MGGVVYNYEQIPVFSSRIGGLAGLNYGTLNGGSFFGTLIILSNSSQIGGAAGGNYAQLPA